MQAVKTIIEGTDNALYVAIDAGVKRVVCFSTDKAAYPINSRGISKADDGACHLCECSRSSREK